MLRSDIASKLMRNALLITIAGILVILAVAQPYLGCHGGSRSNQGLRTIQMRIGGRSFTLEVADTETLRQTGLMNRDSLPRDRGMVFVFPYEHHLSFWMKNTRIPLDILYLDGEGRIVSIRQMQPNDLRSVTSGAPARYAIELNQGMAAEVGVKAGDRLDLPREIAP